MGRFSLRDLRTFTSFKNPIYRLYFGAMLGQNAGMNMQMFARMWLVYRLTGSPAIMGAMGFANAVPMLSLSLFGGVIADRVQKKYVLLIGQAASAVVSLGIALTLTTGYLSPERAGSLWVLIVASVLQGTIMALMMPSRMAILPEIVGQEQLMNAMSLSNMAMSGLRLFAPALTGFLIGKFDYQSVYYIQTGMYLISVVLIAFVPPTSTMALRGGGALANIKEGIKYIRRETTLLLIIGFVLLVAVLSMPFQLLMPVIVVEVLDKAEAQGGVLMGLSGAGAIVGSLVLASLPNRKRGIMMLISCVVTGVALVLFAFSGSWPLSVTMIIFVGLAQTGQMTLGFTLLQYYTEDEYRGRVMSLIMMQFGLVSFGTFLAGVLAEAMGVQWAIGGFAMVLVIMAILGLAFVPRVRKLD
jgi:MFS family permease